MLGWSGAAGEEEPGGTGRLTKCRVVSRESGLDRLGKQGKR
jgi:hypothetical protein